MSTHRHGVLLLAAVLGCADPSASGPEGGGGKADDPAAAGDVACLVVHVLDDNVLEEGLTAVFDIDDRGSLQGDQDGTTVSVSPGEGRARLGHHAFSRSNGDEIETLASHRYVVTAGDRSFELRVFESGLGTLTVAEDGGSPEHFATLDCRAGAKAPNDDAAEGAANCAGTRFESGHCRFDNGQFAEARCCRPSCDVVLVDDGEFEESLGALYDVDTDGAPNVDEDATSLGADLAKGTAWSIGTMRFTEAGGDAISRQPGLESLFQRWEIDSTEAGVKLEIRIFDQSRLGTITIRGGDGGEEKRPLARLDCRGLTRPSIFE